MEGIEPPCTVLETVALPLGHIGKGTVRKEGGFEPDSSSLPRPRSQRLSLSPDSNRDVSQHRILSAARLPISPESGMIGAVSCPSPVPIHTQGGERNNTLGMRKAPARRVEARCQHGTTFPYSDVQPFTARFDTSQSGDLVHGAAANS